MSKLLDQSLEIVGMRLDRTGVRDVDRRLGYPSRAFPSVHIAGTNGKGSVATKIARSAERCKKRVGLFTSPHISTFRERIQINGESIPEQHVEPRLEKIVAIAPRPLSYFELLTLLAFDYFAEAKVDLAVIETGLGGRLDGTNCITPLLSVITSISYDHCQYLGETLEEIAGEKAGIIKEKIPVVIGPRAFPHDVFEHVAQEKNAPLYRVEGTFAHYEEENRAVAAKALQLLDLPLDPEALSATPPCRFEWWGKDLLFDVAHNPDGIERTFERIGPRPVRVLAAFTEFKDSEASLSVLKKRATHVHLTQGKSPYMRPFEEATADVATAFEEAYFVAQKKKELLLVCGTFFIMEEARTAATKLNLAPSSC